MAGIDGKREKRDERSAGGRPGAGWPCAGGAADGRSCRERPGNGGFGGRSGRLLALCLAAVLALTGCGGAGGGQASPEGEPAGQQEYENGDSAGQALEASASLEASSEEIASSEGTASPQAEGIPFQTHYVTPEMYERATSFMEGDLTRLAAAMRKAQAGESVTVAVIGGSITEGYSASDKEKCYGAYFRDWWQERFPDTQVNYVNAGIGGTSSYLGVHRVQEDVLDYNPDAVIVEFSVNDGNNAFYQKSYENLVRRILLWESSPAVILLFTTQENGTSAQENDSLVGFRCKVPMISYGNAVLPQIEAGELTWKEISPDNIHPNDKGHAIIGELLYTYLNGVYARLDEIGTEIAPFEASPLTKQRYQQAQVLDGSRIEPLEWGSFEKASLNSYFPDNWHTDSGEEAIVFEVEAAAIGLIYQRTVTGDYGQFDVYVDGTCVRTLDGNFPGGWGTAMETEEIYASDEKALHRVEIRRNPDSTGDLFTVIGLLVS